MKWLPRHLLRYLCILPVLYIVVLYTLCQPGISITDFMNAAGGRVLDVLGAPNFLIAAGVLLLLVFVRGMTLVWNAVYCCATILLLLEIILLVGIGGAILPTALWSIPGAEVLTQIPAKYPVAMYIVPFIWLLGTVSTNAFRSITAACCINFIIWLLLSYACHALAQQWETMQEPYKPELLAQFKTMRWCTAILPGLFMFLYTFFLSIFEALIPRSLLKNQEKKEKKQMTSSPAQQETTKAQEKQKTASSPAKTTEKTTAKSPVAPLSKPISKTKPKTASKPVLKTATSTAKTETKAEAPQEETKTATE